MTDLHVVYTDSGDDYGWTVESPQIPELIGGRNSAEELVTDTAEIIAWAKDDATDYDRVFLHELVTDPSGRDYLIRWAFDVEDSDARYETAGRMNAAVHNGLMDDDEVSAHPVLPTTGERLLIAVTDTDTLGWIEGQLSERDGCCVLVQHVGDGVVWNVPFGLGGLLGPQRTKRTISTEQLGLNQDSTFRALKDALVTRELDNLRETHLPPDAVDDIPRALTRS